MLLDYTHGVNALPIVTNSAEAVGQINRCGLYTARLYYLEGVSVLLTQRSLAISRCFSCPDAEASLWLRPCRSVHL